MKTVLKAENISKSYDGVKIIEDINIELYDRELVCILGTSGVGKTTLFNIMSGLLKPDTGKVVLNDVDITGTPGFISYMLQKDLLFSHKKIIDNVSLPLVISGMSKKLAREKAAPYFERFGLENTETKYPAQLSGGMRQRAALLRTYLGSHGVSLLDEPFSALDALTKRDMHNWYQEVMADIGLATLFITHDIDEAILLCDRIYVMSGKPGKIVSEIKIEQKKPRHTDFTLSAEFVEYKRQIIEVLNIK